MNTRAPSATDQLPMATPKPAETPDRPETPQTPSPRRKFILPTFTPGPARKRIDYQTFLSDCGIQRF